MPTFTTVALERLLQPVGRDSHDSSSPLKLFNAQNSSNCASPKRSSHIYFSPALYTTPDPTPVADYPASVSPSPYVYNCKRRNFSGQDNPPNEVQLSQKKEKKILSCDDRDELSLSAVGEAAASSGNPPQNHDDQQEESLVNFFKVLEEPNGNSSVEGRSVMDDDFFEPQVSMSVTSGDDGSSTSDKWKNSRALTPSEFYDAPEEFLSDSSLASPTSNLNFEAELCAARIHLLEEIERRSRAEQALADMCKQWDTICHKMSQAGLSFPVASATGGMQLETELADELCQEVAVARAVAEAVGRGCARAESEAAAEAIINSKNYEITRLRDKLQYYGAVNHEMSLRNQEIVEATRQRRHRRKRRQRWMWTCIGTSIVLGASLLGYLHLPCPGKAPLPISSEDSSLPSDPSASP
ncbi:uncharacterized protein [Aristolochia californica]|uniref:uncharacterized protein isoform X2 n=1 Tax=Aristolochia californica TaxID=171875 RepID=UPI0035D5D37B